MMKNVKKSIYFEDVEGKKCFLFQVLIYGKKDDLKIILHPKNEGLATIYLPSDPCSLNDKIISPYSEITYHKDGNLQYKLFQYNRDYKYGEDRIKKPALIEIDDWEPLIKYNVIDYTLCRKSKSTEQDIFLPKSNTIFNGDPFECFFYLINLKYITPAIDKKDDIVFRINNLTDSVDLLLFIRKSTYHGVQRIIPNTNIKFWDNNNIVTIVNKMKSA